MYRALRPVGETITTRRSRGGIDRAWCVPEGWTRKFYSSGTEALAAACCASVAQRKLAEPEIVMPAYACPAVVSAIEYAGAKPVLVDFEQERPYICLEKLVLAISPATVAVVAVNFLGISERIDQIRRAVRKSGATLIYDHCQDFPVDDDSALGADSIIFSFGRGKPVSALSGGALLVKTAGGLMDYLPPTTKNREPASRPLVAVYNSFLGPKLYAIPQRLPFLHIGETRYTKLDAICGLSCASVDRIASNIEDFAHLPLPIQSMISHEVSDISQIVNLPLATGNNGKRQLRYPILLRSQRQRDRALLQLSRAGLGATHMYARTVSMLPGLTQKFAADLDIPNAADLAGRLLTLPTHEAVREIDVRAIGRILREIVSMRN